MNDGIRFVLITKENITPETLRQCSNEYFNISALKRELRVNSAEDYYGIAAYEGDRMVAYIWGAIGTNLSTAMIRDGHAVVHHVYVAPEMRGEGSCGRLITEIKRSFLVHGCSEMWLQVKPDNESAVRAYKKAGFAEVKKHGS